MDERQLTELFQAAADGGPPARFSHTDVVVASRRAATRRRAMIAGTATLGVAVLLGGALIGNALFGTRDGRDMTAAGSVAEQPAQSEQSAQSAQPQIEPEQGRAQAPPPKPGGSDLSAAPSQGTGESGKVVPWPGLGDGDARAWCGQPDRELAQDLAARLPAADQARVEAVPDACPPQARAVAVPVVDGDAAGWIYLVLAPVRGDGPADAPLKRPDGAVGYQRLAPSSLVLVVLSVPREDGGRAPFASDIPRLAEELGLRY